jgi:phosphoribosylglycinamide formyltransferase-1
MVSPQMVNVGVLASGRGSNFQAIADHQHLGIFQNVNVRVLIYNNPEASAKHIAEKYGIAGHFVDHRNRDRIEFERQIVDLLNSSGVDLVCLAGWDRIVGSEFFQKYRWRIMNIHPALLPSFGWKGLNARYVHEAALEYGVKITGCTVYFIDVSVEKGPIILQHPVRVLESEIELFKNRREDAIQSLSDRVLIHEHQIYSKAIQLYADGRLRVDEIVTRNKENRTNRVVSIDLRGEWKRKWDERQRPFIEAQRKTWTAKGVRVDEESN